MGDLADCAERSAVSALHKLAELAKGKAMLGDHIKATVGFEKLGEATGAPAKSLIGMLDRKRLEGKEFLETAPRSVGQPQRRGPTEFKSRSSRPPKVARRICVISLQ